MGVRVKEGHGEGDGGDEDDGWGERGRGVKHPVASLHDPSLLECVV